jgi:hypothetical protein
MYKINSVKINFSPEDTYTKSTKLSNNSIKAKQTKPRNTEKVAAALNSTQPSEPPTEVFLPFHFHIFFL